MRRWWSFEMNRSKSELEKFKSRAASRGGVHELLSTGFRESSFAPPVRFGDEKRRSCWQEDFPIGEGSFHPHNGALEILRSAAVRRLAAK
jgi:hypothetical protein